MATLGLGPPHVKEELVEQADELQMSPAAKLRYKLQATIRT